MIMSMSSPLTYSPIAPSYSLLSNNKKIVSVPLGILMWNENKTDEIVEILTHLHQYIPKRSEESKVYVQSIGDTQIVTVESLFPMFVGG